MSGDAWARANAALLAARGLEALPEPDARALLALLHAGTLVEFDDARATGALDLERLRLARALAAGELGGPSADAAALRLLALGHREPARARRASPEVGAAWRAWVGEGDAEGEAEPLVVDAVRLAPAAAAARLDVTVAARHPGRVAVRRLRVGATTLDVEVRWRAGAVVVRLQRTQGPPVLVTLAFPAGSTVAADEVPLAGDVARLEVRDRHEVVAYA